MTRLAILRSVAACFAILLFVVQSAAAQNPVGCYIFNRPLGHSARGHLERHDPSWSLLQLRDSGTVARPGLQKRHQEMFSRRSSWTTSGDSIFIITSTGLVGWNITLVPHDGAFAGRALYLTDVVVQGEEPLYFQVHARKVECQPPA